MVNETDTSLPLRRAAAVPVHLSSKPNAPVIADVIDDIRIECGACGTVPPLPLHTCPPLATLKAAMISAVYFALAWLVDADGRLIHTDFLNVWAAGKLALDGQPRAASQITGASAEQPRSFEFIFNLKTGGLLDPGVPRLLLKRA